MLQDRAGEYDAALKVCGRWTSAEPEPPGKTLEEYQAEVDQRLAEADSRFLAAEDQVEKDRAERAERYDQDRAEARLAAGTYGISVISGEPIPDARLEARPTAEMTVEEQQQQTG